MKESRVDFKIMFGKFVKYFILNKDGRQAWDKMQAAKKARKESLKKGNENSRGIPILNTPFTAKPGDSGLIFPDSNPEEQINLIEMAIGEAKKIEADPLQLPPPSATPVKKKTLTTASAAPVTRSLVDMEVGEGKPVEKRLSATHSNKKIEAIYEAMQV